MVFVVSHALARAAVVLALSAPLAVAHTQSSSPARTSGAAEPSVRGAINHLATKHGAWLSLGGSRGGADLFCDVCTQDPTYGWGIDAAIGLRLTPTLLMGLETVGWFDVLGEANRTLRSTTLLLRSYAFGRSRLFVQGGAGLARYRVRDGDAGFHTQSPSLSIGVGQDVRMGSVTLSPNVHAIVAVGGKLQSQRTENAIDPNTQIAMVRAGLTLSWFR